MIRVSKSPAETRKVAKDLAQTIISQKKAKRAIVVALEGELGAGKTVFAKGFARALGIREKVHSPTFVLIKKYRLSITNNQLQNLFHIDAYRLNSGNDLKKLGIKDIFADPGNIVLIEWAERVKSVLPRKHIIVHMDHVSKKSRRISILKPKT